MQSVTTPQANPALRTALALGAFDESALAARVRRLRSEPRAWHASRADRLSLGMAAALLRPLRLLTVAGAGPGCVAEIPFPHVDAAASACADLDGATAPPMTDWLERHDLNRWVIDGAAWRRRTESARRGAVEATAEDVFVRQRGRTVATARGCQMDFGPLDGAEAIEVILDDATVIRVATSGAPVPRQLIGTRLVRCDPRRDAAPVWLFEDPRGARAEVTLLARRGLRVQPSPLPEH